MRHENNDCCLQPLSYRQPLDETKSLSAGGHSMQKTDSMEKYPARVGNARKAFLVVKSCQELLAWLRESASGTHRWVHASEGSPGANNSVDCEAEQPIRHELARMSWCLKQHQVGGSLGTSGPCGAAGPRARAPGQHVPCSSPVMPTYEAQRRAADEFMMAMMQSSSVMSQSKESVWKSGCPAMKKLIQGQGICDSSAA